MTLCETVSPKLENHPLSVVYVREVSLRYRGPLPARPDAHLSRLKIMCFPTNIFTIYLPFLYKTC